MVMFDYRRVAILLGGLPVSLQGIEDWPCGELPFFVAVVRCCKHCELMKLMKSSNKTPWFCSPLGKSTGESIFREIFSVGFLFSESKNLIGDDVSP